MVPYILVLSFVMFWVVLEQKIFNRKSFWMPLLVLALFAGIRNSSVGTDSPTYVRNFIDNLDFNYFIFKENIEFGYQFLEYGLLHLTTNYFWLFFLTALAVVFCYLKIIRKYSVDYNFSIYLFITLGTYTFFFNGMRQGLAMAIFVLTTQYLIEKKYLPYILICFFASFFHISALAMIPFYFLVHVNIKNTYKIFLAFLLSLFGSRFLISYVATTQDRYEGYAEKSDSAGGLLTLSFYIMIMFFLYSANHFYKIKDEIFLRLVTFYMCGIAFIVPIAMLSTNPSGPQRLLNYFSWTLVILLPIVFKKINDFYINLVFVVFMFCYFIMTISKFSNLTPYSINKIFEIF